MKTAAQIANHPKARLHREVIRRLRAEEHAGAAVLAWRKMRRDPRLWRRLDAYGLTNERSQAQLNAVAFPDQNHADVDAALEAGNRLSDLYELACGRAWVARESDGHRKHGRRGVKVIRLALPNVG